VLRDSNQNIAVNRVNQSNTNTTAAGGTTALTAASSYIHTLVGTGGQTYTLPDATTLTTGVAFVFNNLATGTLTVANYAGTTVGTVPSGGAAAVFLTLNSTTGGTWDLHAYLPEGVTFGTNAFNLGTSIITGGTWQGGTIQTAYGGTGLTSYTSGGAVYANSSSTLTSGTLPVTAGGTGNTSGQAASTAFSATFNSGGAGDASGTTFNGSAARTISYNTIGAPSTTGTNASGTWGINVTGTSGSISGFNNPTTAATANTSAYRTADGDIAAREIILSSALQSSVPTVLVAMFPTTNQLVRMTPAAVASAIQSAATGTWGINITGSAGSAGSATTAVTLTSTQSVWNTGVINNVVGMLAWKNYANNHVIFDASAGTSPSGGSVNNTNAQIAWTGTYPTLMGWNGTNTFGVRVDSARVSDSTSSAPGYLLLSGGTMTGTLSFQQPVGLGFANGQYIRDNGGGGLVIYSGAQINLNADSFTTATNSIRAPIFYDSDNTAYYVNPASTSTLQVIDSNGQDVAYSARRDVGASNWSARIVSRNYSYNVASFLGNYNGYAGVFGHSAALDAWAPLYINAFGGTAQANVYLGNMYSPIFYDLNDTGFYVDPNGTSVLNVLSDPALSDSKLYLRTRGDTNHYLWNAADDWEELVMYFGTGFRVSNSSGGGGTLLYCYGSSNGNHVYTPTSFRAPIFYDSNDTAFYLDPGAVGPSATLASSVWIGSQSSDGVLWDYGSGGTYRPGMQIRGQYPHIDMVGVVGNVNHGPTFRFMGYDNGSSGAYKHWVIGTAAQNLTFLDFGFASNASNPHQGISGYEGTTIIRATTSGNVGIGGDWGTYGSPGGNPAYPLHVIGTGFATSDFRSPIFYDSDDTAYYVTPNGVSNVYDLIVRAGTAVANVTDLTSGTAPIRVSNTGTGTGATRYIPMISGTSTSSSGYLQHTVFGSVRGTVWGSALIAVGGNDSYPTVAFTFNYGGDFTSPGNVTAYSDERLKTNWRDMPEDFVSRLAKIKVGIYDRPDLATKPTQVGVGAQSLQTLLPQAVNKADDEMGTLSVSYGNAALASAVELAKYVTALEQRISQLEARL
jgi:hypothetical protein